MFEKKALSLEEQIHLLQERGLEIKNFSKARKYYQYEITGKETKSTRFGELEVFEITGTASSRLGETSLVPLFHPQHGFLQLDYVNIDGSRTEMELVN